MEAEENERFCRTFQRLCDVATQLFAGSASMHISARNWVCYECQGTVFPFTQKPSQGAAVPSVSNTYTEVLAMQETHYEERG